MNLKQKSSKPIGDFSRFNGIVILLLYCFSATLAGAFDGHWATNQISLPFETSEIPWNNYDIRCEAVADTNQFTIVNGAGHSLYFSSELLGDFEVKSGETRTNFYVTQNGHRTRVPATLKYWTMGPEVGDPSPLPATGKPSVVIVLGGTMQEWFCRSVAHQAAVLKTRFADTGVNITTYVSTDDLKKVKQIADSWSLPDLKGMSEKDSDMWSHDVVPLAFVIDGKGKYAACQIGWRGFTNIHNDAWLVDFLTQHLEALSVKPTHRETVWDPEMDATYICAQKFLEFATNRTVTAREMWIADHQDFQSRYPAAEVEIDPNLQHTIIRTSWQTNNETGVVSPPKEKWVAITDHEREMVAALHDAFEFLDWPKTGDPIDIETGDILFYHVSDEPTGGAFFVTKTYNDSTLKGQFLRWMNSSPYDKTISTDFSLASIQGTRIIRYGLYHVRPRLDALKTLDQKLASQP